MKINHNIVASVTNNQLLRTENSLSASMEKLSSGLQINHAKDNPAGLAISNKMMAQIDGLDQANQNAADGQSVIQIADGALNEVTEMLQRMRELAVQAASDTNTASDKDAIQAEIAQLKSEIDRVSTDTEFNTMTLLDGRQSKRIYANSVSVTIDGKTKNVPAASRVNASSYVDTGVYNLKVTQAATQAEITTGTTFTADASKVGVSGKVSINGYEVDIDENDTMEVVYGKLQHGAEKGECTISDPGAPLKFTAKKYGVHSELKIDISDSALQAKLGFAASENTAAPALDPIVSLTTNDVSGSIQNFDVQATAKYDGNRVSIMSDGGFSMDFLLAAGYTGDVNLDVTDIGSMTLQIGANEHQVIDVEIPEISCKSLYLDDLDITTVTGAARGIAAIDEALTKVSLSRANLGAYENRLDYTTTNLSVNVENMTSAYSRIMDVDMAKEMVTYTEQNVLDQAGVSILSQANDLPQTILQLLQ